MKPPSHPPGGPGPDPADSPARLLRAAGPIIAEKGFDRATLREIAAVAGTNVAAISYHFGDKLGLYRAVVDQVRRAREMEFPVPEICWDSDAVVVPDDAIRPIVHTLLRRILSGGQDSWEHLLLMREMQQPTLIFPEIVNEYFRPLFELLCETLGRLIGPHVSRTVIHRMAFSVVGQCLYYRVADRVIDVLMDDRERLEMTDLESLTRHVTDVTVAGIEKYRARCPRGTGLDAVEATGST